MKMEQVNASPVFQTFCNYCHKRLYSSREIIWADLDGEPVKTYYCEKCKNQVETREVKD